MASGSIEDKFLFLLRDIGFDRQYVELCRERTRREVSPEGSVGQQDLKEALELLPISFKYIKSESFFRHREKCDGYTLTFSFSVSGSRLEVLTYLRTEKGVVGSPFPRLAGMVNEIRDEPAEFQQGDRTLRFSDAADLADAVDSAASLYQEIREAVRAAEPWS